MRWVDCILAIKILLFGLLGRVVWPVSKVRLCYTAELVLLCNGVVRVRRPTGAVLYADFASGKLVFGMSGGSRILLQQSLWVARYKFAAGRGPRNYCD